MNRAVGALDDHRRAPSCVSGSRRSHVHQPVTRTRRPRVHASRSCASHCSSAWPPALSWARLARISGLRRPSPTPPRASANRARSSSRSTSRVTRTRPTTSSTPSAREEAALLHIDRPGADQNSEESLRGIPTRPGYDRDEYPPAVSSEGEYGADVRYVPSSDNRGAGASMGDQLEGWCEDQAFRIQTVP